MGGSSSVPILKSEILKLTLDWTLLFSTKKCRCLLSIRGACRRMYRNWLHSLPHWKNKAEQADDFSDRNRKKILHKSLFRVYGKFSSRAALPGNEKGTDPLSSFHVGVSAITSFVRLRL